MQDGISKLAWPTTLKKNLLYIVCFLNIIYNIIFTLMIKMTKCCGLPQNRLSLCIRKIFVHRESTIETKET